LFFAQAPEDPEQPQSASSGNNDFCPADDSVCAFLQERHKNHAIRLILSKKVFVFKNLNSYKITSK
jgi:hypothetical protein